MNRQQIIIAQRISIHSPCVGRDSSQPRSMAFPKKFQSTLPVLGETCSAKLKLHPKQISIHSPCVGRDLVKECFRFHLVFQSTLPVLGETKRN